MRVDLVIICDEPAGYHQELFHQVMAATEHLRLSMNPQERHQPYVIAASAIDERELVLIRNCIRLLISRRRRSYSRVMKLLPGLPTDGVISAMVVR